MVQSVSAAVEPGWPDAAWGRPELAFKARTFGPREAAIKAPAEQSLEAAVVRGDPEALERLVARELPRVERLLLRILGPRADLEDWVQNVFLEACRALPGFRGESSLSTFIGGITVRVARRAMRPTAWWRRTTAMIDEPAAQGPGPEEALHQAHQLHRARKALERIAPKKRVAFLLWAVEGLSVEEISEMTGASVSATRSQIFYAQKELKKRAAHDPYLKVFVGEEQE